MLKNMIEMVKRIKSGDFFEFNKLGFGFGGF